MPRKTQLCILWIEIFLACVAALFMTGLFLMKTPNPLINLAVFQVLFLLVNIPLGIFSLVSIWRKKLSHKLVLSVAVLSVVNILIGIADWVFFIAVLLMP